jgi:LytS/YehU family sensor histidine kinase
VAPGLFVLLGSIYLISYEQYDITAQRSTIIGGFSSFVITANGVLQKKKGAWIVMNGLILCAAISYFFHYDISLFTSFSIIVLCMIYLFAISSKETQKRYESSQLLSARLQTELLKKNIQPHFIKNTLTSLIDWVEESPRDGVTFIQALSGEFEILNQISGCTLIPIRQEIELCKHHLTVMQFRKEVHYYWEDHGIEADDYIPPAVIHTALENGITHSIPLEDGSIRFSLAFSNSREYKQYDLRAVAKNRPVAKKLEAGTGYRYIQARLKESYGDRWEFSSQAVENGWLTTIKIYAR